MKPTLADRERRSAKATLEALATGWSGALMSPDFSADTRAKAREASAAARRAVSQGATPYAAFIEHVAPVFKTAADDLED